MKLLKSSIASITILSAAISMLVGGSAYAQSNKYQRPGKKEAAPVAPAPGTATDKAAAPAAAPAKDAKAVDTKSEKVDIQQIEQDYWQQKDTEFHVVQSRRFTKEKRPFVNLGYGLLINDSFTKGSSLNLSSGYYFKEQHGFEVSYSQFDVKNSKTTDEIIVAGGTPAYNKLNYQLAATYNWMPIYGKVSVFDKSIIYFDMGVHVGLALVDYDHALQAGDKQDSSVALVLDISQQFFLSEKWAFRFDVKNRFYKQDRLDYVTGAAKDDSEHNVSAVFGFTYYFK
ncbi:MAG: outer membrane beta-barrel domain-containing protein [Bdellovibrionota bacterium]